MYTTGSPHQAKQQVAYTIAGLIVSFALTGVWGYLMVGTIRDLWPVHRAQALEHGVFFFLGLGLVWGTFVFLLTRFGLYRRLLDTKYPPADVVNEAFFCTDAPVPALTVLVPCYKEELRIIEMTLLSAALLEYPHKHVVLLVDDPVSYPDASDEVLLQRTRDLPRALSRELSVLHTHIDAAYQTFLAKSERATIAVDDVRRLAAVYDMVKEWFEAKHREYEARDHAEHFFSEKIFDEGRLRYRAVRNEIYALQDHMERANHACLAAYYRRALSICNVEMSFFQRKKYENISHEPNKAMNLNSYIDLMGKRYREVHTDFGTLQLTVDSAGLHEFPAAEYILTLDADSLLTYDYAKKLIHFLEDPAHTHYAVGQTPYNTLRCPFVNLERVAGATTDMQHLIHQGFTYFHASYWVGANAILRVRALDAIKETDTERGFPIARYIQDRTVIEDTESTIDLLQKGWEVYNYLEQLAFSATPPDFGALIIQRRRWANGGLIIFPKLLRYLWGGPHAFVRRATETFVRAHYLVSIALVNVGLLCMLVYPFDGALHVSYLIGVALVYFGFYARDLAALGYRGGDFFRVYAINLLLIPINIAGVCKSLQQILTKKKIPFGRTPKVQGRTAAPPLFIVFELVLMVYLLVGALVDVGHGRYVHMVFSAVNGLFFWYAWTYFIGWRHAYEDVRAGVRSLRAPAE